MKNKVARDGIEPPTPAFSGLRSTGFIFLVIREVDPLLSAITVAVLST
jgi:hypothetical protein